MNILRHWNNIYSSKRENEVSWFQSYPATSVKLIELFNLPLTANIIDIGGGDSHFAEALLDKGYANIYVLDISSIAIERAKARLGNRASQIHWVVSDVNEFRPSVKFELWHDRAAFHFLTSEKDISKYVSIAENAINKNGYLILGTFSEKGPEKCSGLAVKRYSEIAMSARFQFAFNKIKCIQESHKTPFNTMQNFLFCCFKKN